MRIAACIGVALLLHLSLGWEWSLLAGVFCAMMMASRVLMWGAVSTGASWMILSIYNLAVAWDPVVEMIDDTGQIFGNLPGAIIVLLTVLIGSVLGMIGAMIGLQLTKLMPVLKLYKAPPGMRRN